MLASTRLYIARHGESQWNVQNRYQGHEDSDLTSRGLDQVHAVANHLRNKQIMMIYSSDLGRSLKSAQIIGDIIAAPVDATNQLREVHFGVFQGLTDLEIQKRYPNEFAAFSEDCIGYNIPGGESSLQAQHRVMAFLESIAVTHQGKTVAVIGHAGTINSLRWCMESRIAIKSSLNCVENGSIFEFEWTAGNWNLLTRVA